MSSARPSTRRLDLAVLRAPALDDVHARHDLDAAVPAGWDFEKVFGERQRAPTTPTERRADNEQAQVQIAGLKRVQPIVTQAPNTVTLPKTATDAELKMIAGVILLTFSLILFVFTRRQMSLR